MPSTAADTQCIFDVSAVWHLIPSPWRAIVCADTDVGEGLKSLKSAPSYKQARSSDLVSESYAICVKLKILYFNGGLVVAPFVIKGPSLRSKLANGYPMLNLQKEKVRAGKQHSGFAFL